jgi:lactoylglutathione lyase
MLDLVQVDHVGIRVTDGERATRFYESLGFGVTARHEQARVVILRHRSGIELNLIVNGVTPPGGKNVLMDLPEKHPGHTHIALRVAESNAAQREILRLGIAITEGPVTLGDGVSFFVRDPDGNVIELRAPI